MNLPQCPVHTYIHTVHTYIHTYYIHTYMSIMASSAAGNPKSFEDEDKKLYHLMRSRGPGLSSGAYLFASLEVARRCDGFIGHMVLLYIYIFTCTYFLYFHTFIYISTYIHTYIFMLQCVHLLFKNHTYIHTYVRTYIAVDSLYLYIYVGIGHHSHVLPVHVCAARVLIPPA